jgi:hypothetical protein
MSGLVVTLNTGSISGKEVVRRWTNIRDCYIRACTKLKEATHSGAGSVKIRKYIYSDQLRFLHKLTIERSTEDSLSSVIEETERDEPETASASSSEKRSDQASYIRKMHDEVEHMIIKALQAENNPDSNMSFLLV